MATRKLRLSFRQFLKLWAVFGATSGFAFGILGLIALLFGAEVTSGIVLVQLEGPSAAIANLVWGPVLGILLTTVLSPFMYLPFRWILALLGGLQIEEPKDQNVHQDA